jgi:hypothetical protein
MSYLAIITGDWNDADYVTSIIRGDKDRMDELISVYKLTEKFITTFQSEHPSDWGRRTIDELMDVLLYNYETYEEICDAEPWLKQFSKEEVESVSGFLEWDIPSGYECNIHTLKGLKIYEISSDYYE